MKDPVVGGWTQGTEDITASIALMMTSRHSCACGLLVFSFTQTKSAENEIQNVPALDSVKVDLLLS